MNTVVTPSAARMTDYERRRWEELLRYWDARERRRKRVPENVREAASNAAKQAGQVARRAGQFIGDRTPERIKIAAGWVSEAALEPAVEAVTHLLELLHDWSVRLTNPKSILKFHQERGRNVHNIAALRTLDMKDLDGFLRHNTLGWRSLGAMEGGAVGALATVVPVPVAGSIAAITVDNLAVHVMCSTIATRACLAYGFEVDGDPEVEKMIRRMVQNVYAKQAPKSSGVHQAHQAWDAARDRQRWSKKIREDHRLLEAIEKLMTRINGKPIKIQQARAGIPVVSIILGSGTNAMMIGNTAKAAQNYAATRFLADKHGLELPPALRRLDDDDLSGE